jgi:hypothetical protein
MPQPRLNDATNCQQPSGAAVGISEWLGATDSQIIVSEIDEAAAEMSKCYNHLPAPAKASAIKLGHALSNLRRRMVARNAALSEAAGKETSK